MQAPDVFNKPPCLRIDHARSGRTVGESGSLTVAVIAVCCWLAIPAAHAQTRSQAKAPAAVATEKKTMMGANKAAPTAAVAKAPTTNPAADAAKEAQETKNREELGAINKKLTGDATLALDDGKLDVAAAAIEDAARRLTAYVENNKLPQWHRSVASLYQLTDRKRTTLAAKLRAAGKGPATPAAPRPKIAVATLKELAEVRKGLQQVNGMIVRGDVEGAQKIIANADLFLTQAVSESGAPVWHEALAPAFQVLDLQRTALGEELKAIKEEAVIAAEEAADARDVLKVGDPAPAFNVVTVDGKPLTSKSLAGKWVLIDFWATWCGPCIGEIPHLQEVYGAYGKDTRFAMVSLSIDKEMAKPRAFAQQSNMKWIQGFLGKGWEAPLLQAYGVQGIPAIFLIGPDGKIAAKGLRGPRIKAVLDQVLADKGGV